jgi:hypothetical protein
MAGQGDLDRYPHQQPGFYAKFMKGENPRAGWPRTRISRKLISIGATIARGEVSGTKYCSEQERCS